MAHPQSSPRGYFAKDRIDCGGAQLTNDSSGNLLLNAGLALSGETTDVITQNSTALLLSGGLALSGEETDVITQNSTGLLLSGGIALSGEETDVITQDSTAVIVAGGITLSGQASSLAITQDATAVSVPGQLKVGGARYVGGNSTAYLFTAEAALPETDGGTFKWTFIVNSTGVAGIAINTTGTTWKYVRMTSEINTT